MKYMGSKRRIAKEITSIINKIISEKEIKTYIEPFVGGANVIELIKCKNRIGGDNNQYLIELFKSLQNGYIPLKFISRKDFYDIKYNKEKYSKEVVALCGILASYNGNWFGAYGGFSSTKTGRDRNFYDEGVRGLMKQVPNLIGIDFRCCDYKKFSKFKNAMIYCDKPYDKTDKPYEDKNFDHAEFWEWARRMNDNNIVIISEFEAPSDFSCIYRKELYITHARQKAKSVERLFTLSK